MKRFATVILSLATIASGSLALVACGGGGGDTGNTTTNSAAAVSTAEAATELRAALASNDGDMAAAAANGLIGQGAAVIQLDSASAAQSNVIEPVLGGGGTCSCTDGDCTFTNCGIASVYEISGTISSDGDTITIDLTATLGAEGFAFSWTIDGTITVTDTLLTGMMNGTGELTFEGEGGSGMISWDFSVTFNDVTFNANDCPTGGDVSATVDYQISGSNGGQSGSANYAGSGTVTFDGSTCS